MLGLAVDDAYLEVGCPRLRIVANYAVGVYNIDLEAARRRGIVISNTPDVLTGATAEVALTLMLSLLRRVTEGDRLIRRREPWEFSLEFMLGREPRGEDGADRRRRAHRPRDGAARRGVRCERRPRRPRRRPRRAPARRPTSSRSTPRSPTETRHLIDARRLRADAADRRADQHRPRPRRRRGRAGRGASRRRRSRAPGSTSTSTSRR